MNKTEQLKDLRSKALGVLSSVAVSDVEFVSWLATYASRAQGILHGEASAEPSEGQRRDAIKENGRFHNSTEVVEWANEYKVLLPHNQHWWWLNPEDRTGKIVNLESSWGVPRITNGIDVWIERADGSVFLGHRDWLVYDKRERADMSRYDGNGNLIPRIRKAKSAESYFSIHLELAKKILVQDSLLPFAAKYSTLTKLPFPILVNPTPEILAPLVKVWMDKVEESAL